MFLNFGMWGLVYTWLFGKKKKIGTFGSGVACFQVICDGFVFNFGVFVGLGFFR